MAARWRLVGTALRGDIDRDALADQADTTRLLIIGAIVLSNVIGASIVAVLLAFVLPLPAAAAGHGLASTVGVGAVAVIGFVVIASAVGVVIGVRLARPVSGFFHDGRVPDESERRATLRLPLTLLKVQAALWGLAVLVFGGVALRTDGLYGFEVAITTVLGGIPTSSMAYLVAQRLLRSGVAVALGESPPRTREVPGVRARALLAWSLGAVPIGGLITVAGFAPFTDVSIDQLARSIAALGGVSILVGLAAADVVGRSAAEPLQRLRDAFSRVREGDFDVDVPVYDATEVGYAAAGFNEMAAGLREREELRDLFGRQVGTDVARRALEEGVTLGGEERHAAALFVDIIGSTNFAADRPPTEVVDALNEFFGAVVGATQDHGGLVNKFIGDAALCVFGAPLASDDPAGDALNAARDMIGRLAGTTLSAGIGVAYGTVVAGNVGTAERFEYTVIGDPVNEAARITDLAKDHEPRVLASWEAVTAAGEQARGRWREIEPVTVRGRSRPTRLAEPAD